MVHFKYPNWEIYVTFTKWDMNGIGESKLMFSLLTRMLWICSIPSLTCEMINGCWSHIIKVKQAQKLTLNWINRLENIVLFVHKEVDCASFKSKLKSVFAHIPLPAWLLTLLCPRNLCPLPLQKLPLALPELIFLWEETFSHSPTQYMEYNV